MNKFKILIFSAAIGLAGSFLLGGAPDAAKVQEDIAGKILRFHVIANSDSEEDQALKLKVKDAVVEYMAPYLTDTMALSETKELINAHSEEIVGIAEAIVRENGYDYAVTACITHCYFPVKAYGDITLPAGEYEAFRIRIGDASGRNWWCILYPPLCFIDISYGIVPDSSKILLQNILDDEEYRAITADDDTRFEFKYLTFLNDWL